MRDPWKATLQKILVKNYGKKEGLQLTKVYGNIFPANYCDTYEAHIAAQDIIYLQQLSNTNPLITHFYQEKKTNEPLLHLRLFQWKKPIALSDSLPMLENFNLRTYRERSYEVTLKKQSLWISDFTVIYPDSFNIKATRDLFKEAFSHVYLGYAENDSFNKLILGALISINEVVLLRAYAKYLRQVGFPFSQAYIEKAFVSHAPITKKLVELFIIRHLPLQKHRKKKSTLIEDAILRLLDNVQSLDEDRIFRRTVDLIKATMRTNFFQKEFIQPLAFKFSSKVIPELPKPVPLYEIFIYSAEFEAIHLRNKKVARGGLRYSDRPEDFRTEVLALMKAQIVKNAIIVPSGAKGGFIIKNLSALPPELIKAKVIDCYKSFVSGMLDLTDNIKGKTFIRPAHMVCYDEPDPYLVVAADKGTASFSDIANHISKEHKFWLGDAFASGGSSGYDHKKMGITARGAWESIKRHFRELDIDILKDVITVVGIGDMSGDVFGNGLIYTKNIKLLGAFDHRHIFLDPTPNPALSFKERQRLFRLPSSSWADYNPRIISKGGGVYSRQLKAIKLSRELKILLKTDKENITPLECIRALLCAEVDLLFNGGIGTYVKASTENDAMVGDRANDACRINGNQLNCKVVGEGGNLGFTQLGRVEFALKGGLINTDFIDNAGGVNCSDHEVNLKILIDQDIKKKLSEKKRKTLLFSLTEEVAQLVLKDNYQQALLMSFSAFHAKKNMGLHIAYIKELENLKIIDREVDFLPDNKKLAERQSLGEGLTRPELAVLLAYTKIHLKHEILKEKLVEDPYLYRALEAAFPPSIRKKYHLAMKRHRLKREIIATEISNSIVNKMGITFIYRLQVETGATIAEIIRAYTLASHVFDTHELQKMVENLDFKLPMDEQYEMLMNIRHLISLTTRWFLHSVYLREDLSQTIYCYTTRVKKLEEIIPELMGGATKKYLTSLTEKFVSLGISKTIARRIAVSRAIYTSLNIIYVAIENKFELIKTAKVYFAAGERMSLLWFRDQLLNDTREGHWNVLARLTLRDELDIAQRALTIVMMNENPKINDINELIKTWMGNNQNAVSRWKKLLAMLQTSSNVDYTMFFIAIRELIGLIMASSRKFLRKI